MDYLIQFQINIFALAILIALFHIIREKSKVESFSRWLLKRIMLANVVAIIVEPLTWILDGLTFPGAYFLEYTTNVVLFMVGPILGGLMLSYVDYHIFKDPKRIYKKSFYQHVSLFTLLLLIVNIFYPIYFSVTPADNSFHSEVFQNFHYIIIGSMYFYMVYFILVHRRKTSGHTINIFLSFFGLPFIGMVIQLFIDRLHFSWAFIVLAILVAYIFLETASMEEDHLTKLYNRRSYEIYAQNLIELGKPFGAFLIDLNNFKSINDQYGHQKGDQVLIDFAQVLRHVFTEKALVSRLGGDEFMIVIEKSLTDAESYAQNIHERLLKCDDQLMRSLSFSYGYQAFSNHMTMDELYNAVDKKMYVCKAQFKTPASKQLHH